MSADGALFVSARPRLTVNGQPATFLERDLIRLEVTEDDTGLARLEAVFLNWGAREGSAVDYVHFDTSEIDFGAAIRVAFDGGSGAIEVFAGTVTALGGTYPELRAPEFMLRAEDDLARARIRRSGRVAEQGSDADAARNVADALGLRADVTIDAPSREQVAQAGAADLAHLRRQAERADAPLVLRDGVLRLRPRSQTDGPPIALSRLNQLIRFEVHADLAQQRSAVRVRGWDIDGGEAIEEEAGSDAARAASEGAGRLGPDVAADVWQEAVEEIQLAAPATSAEARSLAEAAMRRRARGFVSGRGVARGDPRLRATSRVELADLGRYFDGVYEITAVTHGFDQVNGYRTGFDCVRATLGGA